MVLTDALSLRNWLCGRGFILRAANDQIRVIPFWRLSDEERDAVRRYEHELVTLLKRGWLAARREELPARSRALYAPDGSPGCWWCAAPARGDGGHLCDTCAIARQAA
ncbi:MAG: hypothetical protein H0V00_03775 [Chloroflexia bacterium]|nr:hypothetical protein [Chloroflexia bacterium]